MRHVGAAGFRALSLAGRDRRGRTMRIGLAERALACGIGTRRSADPDDRLTTDQIRLTTDLTVYMGDSKRMTEYRIKTRAAISSNMAKKLLFIPLNLFSTPQKPTALSFFKKLVRG